MNRTKAALLDQLKVLAHECSEKDWDGYGALPINPATLRKAQKLVQVLPDGFLIPECAAEPDGAISLDWIKSNRHCLFSVSVNGSDRLAYAWMDGPNKWHGVFELDGLTFPSQILRHPLLRADKIGRMEKMKYVIVRTYSAGVFAGELESRTGREVVLRNSRRLWMWQGANTLSEMAMVGPTKPKQCKFACVVARVELLEVIEIIDTTDKARKCIEGVPQWE